jgi:hypothetical protein
MEWDGMEEFQAELQAMKRRMQTGAARHCYEAATLQRDRALQNMGAMGIGLVTGRSRALYGVRAAKASFMSGGSVAAFAGYLEWENGIVFYPEFLDTGTVKMISRPYHTEALETSEAFFFQEASRVTDFAITGRWEP